MEDRTQTVSVDLGDRSYGIDIGRGVLSTVGSRLAALPSANRVVVITDDTVGAIYGQLVEASIRDANLAVERLTIPAGEPSKSVAVAERLWQQVLSSGADRKTVIVALGGGVVGDLAGFVAATFGRGIRLVQLPTSLLAQVDSSVGGKVGINLPGAKNTVGCFWQPAHVMIDLATLDTLPQNQLAAGMAEVIKYGVIRDDDFFVELEQNIDAANSLDATVLAKIVSRCCQIKADVVAADEREESGTRAILNYGHTFGHALESLTGYTDYLHGEAVAIGMTMAAHLAIAAEMVDQDLLGRQTTLLEKANLPTSAPKQDVDQFIAAMQRDKKTVNQNLVLVLPDRLGNVVLRDDLPIQLVRDAIAAVAS